MCYNVRKRRWGALRLKQILKQSRGIQVNEASDVLLFKTNQAPIQRFDVRCFIFLIQASKPLLLNATSLQISTQLRNIITIIVLILTWLCFSFPISQRPVNKHPVLHLPVVSGLFCDRRPDQQKIPPWILVFPHNRRCSRGAGQYPPGFPDTTNSSICLCKSHGHACFLRGWRS